MLQLTTLDQTEPSSRERSAGLELLVEQRTRELLEAYGQPQQKVSERQQIKNSLWPPVQPLHALSKDCSDVIAIFASAVNGIVLNLRTFPTGWEHTRPPI